MCLMLYLGVSEPLDLPLSPVESSAVGIRSAKRKTAGLAAKPYVYEIVDLYDRRGYCSCIFEETIVPWEADKGYPPDDPDTVRRESAYAALRDFCSLALDIDPEPFLLSSWTTETENTPVLTRNVQPADLRPARFLFCNDSGMAPPILLRLHRDAITDERVLP